MSEGEFMVFRLGNSFFVEPVGKPDGVLVATGDYARCIKIAEQHARQRAKQRSRSGCEYEAVRCGDAYSLRRK